MIRRESKLKSFTAETDDVRIYPPDQSANAGDASHGVAERINSLREERDVPGQYVRGRHKLLLFFFRDFLINSIFKLRVIYGKGDYCLKLLSLSTDSFNSSTLTLSFYIVLFSIIILNK